MAKNVQKWANGFLRVSPVGASPLDIDTNSQNIMVTRERKLIVMDATNSY